MFIKIFNVIRSFMITPVSDKHREEFVTGINKVNVTRAKITASVFIVLEAIQLAITLIVKWNSTFNKTDIYYEAMYLLMLMGMIIFLLTFTKFDRDISKYRSGIWLAGILFAGFILLWCAGISLLDQLSSGQIIVYTVAIIAIAVTPIYEPITLFLIYLFVNSIFFVLLPYFQKNSEILFANYINSVGFLIISWAISCMRYKNQVDDFNNRKLLQIKSDEINRINKELEDANHKLERLSRTDGLTGIFNRYVFDTEIKVQWNRCKDNFIPLSLIMIDIDFFKAFNDNYGHQAGDKCLIQVSKVLSECAVPSSGMVARYGGEEFAIIITNMEKETVIEIAEQLRNKVEQLAIPHMHSSISKVITISLGVNTAIPTNESSVEEFIAATDRALYEAKKERNRVVAA